MARPQKQVVDYFPHDAKASDGDTLTILQSRFGNDGYAFWFKLLEKVSSSENHVIDCRNPVKWQLLLAKAGTNEDKGTAIMELLCELEAIDSQLWRNSKLIWCQKLVDNITDVYKGRNRPTPERPVFAVYCADNPVSSADNPVSSTESTQSKVKESKGKERKGKVEGYTAPDGAEHIDSEEMNPIEEEIASLKSWGELTQADREWIEQWLRDYPGTIASDIRDCRDYWMAKQKPHNAKVWKSRLRNWMKRKDQFGGNGATNKQGARRLPTKYTPAPKNDRPLLRP